MTTDTTQFAHAPSPQFRDYLEGEVVRTWRRDRTFRRLRGVAMVFASLAIGLSAGLAPAQVRQVEQRVSLLQSAEVEMYLAALRLDLARKQLTDVTARVQSGVAGRDVLTSAQAELKRMEAEGLRAKLNVDEIKATALPPRDDLNAPLVNERDFVSERLMASLYVAQDRLTRAEERQEEAERRARVGAAMDVGLLDAELEVARARAALGALAEARKLRGEHLEKGTPGDQLLRRLEQQRTRLDAMVAQTALNVAKERLSYVRKQRAVGSASELDELRAQVEVKERETELMLLARHLVKP